MNNGDEERRWELLTFYLRTKKIYIANFSAFFFIGTTSNVGIQFFGTSCVTKTRIFKAPKGGFQRNSLNIFRISMDQRYQVLFDYYYYYYY